MRKSCYGCFFEVSSKCYWFSLAKKEHPKPIPQEIINKGCSKYKNTELNNKITTPVILTIMKAFDGEIVGEKYKPPVKPTRTYKKKYVKSPHKYSHRKDAQ